MPKGESADIDPIGSLFRRLQHRFYCAIKLVCPSLIVEGIWRSIYDRDYGHLSPEVEFA